MYGFECENVGMWGKGRVGGVMGRWGRWFKGGEGELKGLRELYWMG